LRSAENRVIRAASVLAAASFLAFWMTLLASQVEASSTGSGQAVVHGAHAPAAR
jgi:hypothetical protein